jgi:hypothetical protein
VAAATGRAVIADTWLPAKLQRACGDGGRISGVLGEEGPRPLSPRQESVLAQLRDMIGEGPAALFSDACVVLSQEPRLAAASHIVSHLLREVEAP